MNQTYNVTLNRDQLWEIRHLLVNAIAKENDNISYAGYFHLDDSVEIFKIRIKDLTSAFNALPEMQ